MAAWTDGFSIRRFIESVFTSLAGVHTLDLKAGADNLSDYLGSAGAITYGMEDDWDEADAARSRVANFIRGGPFQGTRISNDTFGLVVCRMPKLAADPEVKSFSSVQLGLVHYTDTKLVPGGLALFMADPNTFAARSVHNALLRRFDLLGRWQIGANLNLVLARKLDIRASGKIPEDLPDPQPIHRAWERLAPKIRVPHGTAPATFSSTILDVTQAMDLAKASPVWDEVDRDIMRRARAQKETPPLPLRQGHVALQLATGRLDGVIGQGDNRHVIKGRVIRRQGAPITTVLEDGRTETVLSETLAVEIAVLDRDGQVHRYVSEDVEDEEEEG